MKFYGKKWLSAIGRTVLFGGAAAVIAVLPVDWRQLGQRVATVAAGLQQPGNTARMLSHQLETAQTAQSIAPAAAAVPAAAAPDTPPPTATQVVSTGTAVTAVPSVPVPAEDGSGGKIFEKSAATGDEFIDGVAVRNLSGTKVDITPALNAELCQTFVADGSPEVLIIHTHTTEQYMLYDAGFYNAADRARTIDTTRGVCAVGEAVAQTLRQAGIGALHDTTVHDSPAYSGAYTRSAQTVQKNLEANPGIKVVLDLHRDAIMADSVNLVKPTVTADGRKAAQLLFIAGVVSTDALPHPNHDKNLQLAVQWQRRLAKAYPGLMRPVSLVASRYNEHLSTGYLLVEVGSEGNTLEEAVYSGQLLGKTLAELLSPG